MSTLKPFTCHPRRSSVVTHPRPCVGRVCAAAVIVAMLLSITQLLQLAHANSTYVLPQLINVCCIQNEGFSLCKPGSDIRSYHGLDVLLLQESFRRMNIIVRGFDQRIRANQENGTSCPHPMRSISFGFPLQCALPACLPACLPHHFFLPSILCKPTALSHCQ